MKVTNAFMIGALYEKFGMERNPESNDDVRRLLLALLQDKYKALFSKINRKILLVLWVVFCG